jgi:hypothetical protein
MKGLFKYHNNYYIRTEEGLWINLAEFSVDSVPDMHHLLPWSRTILVPNAPIYAGYLILGNKKKWYYDGYNIHRDVACEAEEVDIAVDAHGDFWPVKDKKFRVNGSWMTYHQAILLMETDLCRS